MWIKICGNTRLEDCLLASQLGANAVGFVFAPGKRTVTAQHVAEITAQLPATVEKIGVFTSANAEEITQAANAAGLTGIQLHGEYDPALVRAVSSGFSSKGPLRLLQVIHWDLDLLAEAQLGNFAAGLSRIAADGLVDAILVDSCTAQRSGGTGRTFDWQAVAPIVRNAELPVIVAGGLTPCIVVSAVRALGPWGVDVSSGVEDMPGIKNGEQVRDFVQAVRGFPVGAKPVSAHSSFL